MPTEILWTDETTVTVAEIMRGTFGPWWEQVAVAFVAAPVLVAMPVAADCTDRALDKRPAARLVVTQDCAFAEGPCTPTEWITFLGRFIWRQGGTPGYRVYNGELDYSVLEPIPAGTVFQTQGQHRCVGGCAIYQSCGRMRLHDGRITDIVTCTPPECGCTRVAPLEVEAARP